MEIKLEQSVNTEIVKKEALIVLAEKINVKMINDYPKEKKVEAILEISGYAIKKTLWSGEGYDLIGNWTNEQVKERIIELFS